VVGLFDVTDELTHFDEQGAARMVAISDKPETLRTATAMARVHMAPGTLARVLDPGGVSKGDVLQVARLAAIGAVKTTATAIPLCHPVRVVGVDVELGPLGEGTGIEVRVTVQAIDRTGCEMEALHAAAIGALTIYDMCKAIDRAMTIDGVMLLHKAGGRSGEFVR
jgi:cyclic pyranopterin phosphate synthase